jgi:ribosomal protein S18 acetylase RimI-like enzyme
VSARGREARGRLRAPPAAARVRPARAREIDRVAALFTLLGEHHAAVASLAPAREAGAALRAHVAGIAADGDSLLLVAEAEGQLVGFAAARVLRRPPLFAETERGEIEALFVREEWRRRGVATALVEEVLRALAARGVRRAALQVAVANETGQRFWRALGFADAMDVLERAL